MPFQQSSDDLNSQNLRLINRLKGWLINILVGREMMANTITVKAVSFTCANNCRIQPFLAYNTYSITKVHAINKLKVKKYN